MSESNQQQQASNGTENNVQWAATHVAPAPGVVTQVRSETTTYATDGDRFVERHEVLAGPLGEEEGYVEKREGHLGVPSGGVVEEVEEGREIGLLEPEGKGGDVDAIEGEEEEEEEEDEGGEKEIGAVNGDAGGVVGEEDLTAAAAGIIGKEDEGEGTKEPEPSKAGTPDQGVSTSTKKSDTGPAAAAAVADESDKKAEKKAATGPAATVAAEAAGEAPVRAAREKEAEVTSTSLPSGAAGGEVEEAGGGEDRKRKAEGGHGEGEKRGRGRPAKGEGNAGKGKEPVEGTRRSTRAKGRSE